MFWVEDVVPQRCDNDHQQQDQTKESLPSKKANDKKNWERA
jgi:hypothetical protein